MALAFERRPEPCRTFRRPSKISLHFGRWIAHCAITSAFGFIAGSLIFL